ncbi:MAG: hypothetical protein OSJ70_06730 [Bacilli bacterium]|nr:hypothetical protein [Bacilli bacterium]
MKNLTRDIYVYNNGKLNDKGYFLLELKEKREAIDEVLREYLVKIIKMIKVVGHDLDELDVKGLIQYLKDALNPEDVDQVLSSIIFYIMGLIEEIQKFAPDWRLSEDEDAIENPYLTIRGNKLYSLEPHKDSDLVTVFDLVYTYLQKGLDELNYEQHGDMNDIHKYTLRDGLQ